jgi:hypothetical protein
MSVYDVSQWLGDVDNNTCIFCLDQYQICLRIRLNLYWERKES